MNIHRLRIVILIPVFFFACIDPVEPEFENREGLIYIDAQASTVAGASFVKIYESTLLFGIYTNVFVEGAKVIFRNVDTGDEIQLEEEEDSYVPLDSFRATVGDQWILLVTLQDGTEYRSQPEKVVPPVEISEIDVEYAPQLDFDESQNKFFPGHSISVSFNDPTDSENFYYWNFRSFEKKIYCQVCENSFFRDGNCQGNTSIPYFTYGCDVDCWRIRFGQDINLFSDELTNGKTTSKLPVANIPLYNTRKVLVQLQQFSLTPSAYEYFRRLKDLVGNNSGFNAPLPAALVGNLFNPANKEEYVLGRFTAASTSTRTVLIERSAITDDTVENDLVGNFEEFGSAPPPVTNSVPCVESRYSTGVRPEGWQD